MRPPQPIEGQGGVGFQPAVTLVKTDWQAFPSLTHRLTPAPTQAH